MSEIGLNNCNKGDVALVCPTSSDNSYNDNKIRFPAPVPVDARVRGKAEVVSIDEKGGGWWEVCVITRKGNEKPCFVGDSVTRVAASNE